MIDEALRHCVAPGLDLVPLRRELAPVLFALTEEYRSDLARWLPWPNKVRQLADTEAYIAQMLLLLAQRQAMQFAIEMDGQVIGVCGFNKWSRRLARGELGYWLAPPWRGKGVITGCCRWLCAYGFITLGLQQMQIAAATGNLASRAVCERLGMRLHVQVAAAEQLDHGLVDHAIYRLSRSEWEQTCQRS